MTDVGMSAPGTASGSAPPMMVSRSQLTGSRVMFTTLGLAAGVVGFVGYWMNFFAQGNSSLSSANSWWYNLVPIFIGLGLIGLFMPRMNYFFSGLPLIALGLVFGIRGDTPAIQLLAGAAHVPTGNLSYGPGFWMVAIGAGVLTLCALMIIGGELQRRRA